METKEIFKAFINELKENGFNVYTSSTSKEPNYIHFTKDNKIGYAQYEKYTGITMSSVHKPCIECGTGFRVVDETLSPTISNAEQTFITAPNWATDKEYKAVKKYKSWEEFNDKSHSKQIEL